MRPRRRIAFEKRIVLTSLTALALLVITLIILLVAMHASMRTVLTVAFAVAAAVFIGTYVLYERLVYPLRTLTNLIAAIREEDYSLRARDLHRDDVIGEAMRELDVLRDAIEQRKLEAIEATALLRAVLAEIDAAIFTFDPSQRLRLVNRAGERLLGRPSMRLIGETAETLGLADLIAEDAPPMVERRFANSAGRWSIRQSVFRENGEPHRLLFIADISRALREEEVLAWQRLVRVLSHELNNSLAPIQSIAESTARLVAREPLPDDWRDDASGGLRVIAARAESLTRFMRGYAQLAKVPQPKKHAFDLGGVIRRVASLEKRMTAHVIEGPKLTVDADEDQIEQLLINVLKNAVDASLETGGGVRIEWRARANAAIVEVLDEGAGLTSTANLFVPFFTTKPSGSGVGLVLVQQIADAHGATFTLENRRDRQGCVATLTLPV